MFYTCLLKYVLLATQLLIVTDFDLFCVNLILILCKMIDFFIKIMKVKFITVNISNFKFQRLIFLFNFLSRF